MKSDNVVNQLTEDIIDTFAITIGEKRVLRRMLNQAMMEYGKQERKRALEEAHALVWPTVLAIEEDREYPKTYTQILCDIAELIYKLDFNLK